MCQWATNDSRLDRISYILYPRQNGPTLFFQVVTSEYQSGVTGGSDSSGKSNSVMSPTLTVSHILILY